MTVFPSTSLRVGFVFQAGDGRRLLFTTEAQRSQRGNGVGEGGASLRAVACLGPSMWSDALPTNDSSLCPLCPLCLCGENGSFFIASPPPCPGTGRSPTDCDESGGSRRRATARCT